MYKKYFLLFFLILVCKGAYSQTDTGSHLRISLLTCGVGDDLYASFGHTGVRVIDSVEHTDIVFNYGTFDFGDPDFYTKFTRGKLLYYISYDDFSSFMQEYVVEHRSVQEQVIQVPEALKENIYAFLQWNALPSNKYYKYDFLFDNCATRIRDIFPHRLGQGFEYGQILPADKKVTFRDVINQYLYRKHWERFGINLLLGSKVDKPMTNESAMFLPDFLRDGVGAATLNGKKIASAPVVILPGSPLPPPGVNGPFILTCILALLTIIGLVYKPLHVLGRVMSGLLLLITGLLGFFMLFMWFGTDHQTCQDNLNILWALPTNLVLAFNTKRKNKYALIAIVLLLISLLLHVLKIQELPLLELGPVLLALLFIYGTIYKQKTYKTVNG